jgi:Glycosyl transferases group 1
MNLITSTNLRALKDKAVEVALNTLASAPQSVNPAWHINAGELKGVIIRWPTRYEWPRAHLWVDTLLYGFRRRARVEMTDLEQPYKGTVLFQFVVKGKAHDVAIDYSDYPEINEESARRCPVYFKMQHAREGYNLGNVLPGGYVSDGRKIYLHLPRLRKIRDRRDFQYDVTGRFSLEFAGETRRRAVEILSAQKDFKFEGGLTKVGYLDFLKEIARSRICIDLPGEGDFCHRLINYFAIGACVISARHGNVLNAPLVDREHLAYTKDDFSDLVELCKFYLENEEAREAMCRKSRQFFEQNLHKDNLTAYYLRSCLDRLLN